jgi:uncharacterized protein (TIGR02271 family)
MDSIDVRQLVGRQAVGRDGQRLGRITDLFLDERTGEPAWMAVGTSGARTSLVPLAEAQVHDGDVHVPYDEALVAGAPHAGPDGGLSADEQHRLYTHYGFRWAEDEPTTAVMEPAEADAVEVVRSEEELHVGVERRIAGRARLRKVVVTDVVTTTVPLRRQVLHVEREPVPEDQAVARPGALSEEEHEVVLVEEHPVVSKEVVPKERVRLRKATYVEEQTIEAEVRRERIEAEEEPGRP